MCNKYAQAKYYKQVMIKKQSMKIQQEKMIEYPNIANWIHKGFIEISYEFGRDLVARALDKGGVVWEGGQYKNTDEAMQALDSAIAQLA